MVIPHTIRPLWLNPSFFTRISIINVLIDSSGIDLLEKGESVTGIVYNLKLRSSDHNVISINRII